MEEIRLYKEDISSVRWLKKRLAKNPKYRFFLASKTGSNARGDGANRSVILASDDGKEWFQAIKVWGKNDVNRAKEIIRLAKLK